MTMTEHIKIGPYVCDVKKRLDDGALFTHPMIHPDTVARIQFKNGMARIIDTNPTNGRIRSYIIK